MADNTVIDDEVITDYLGHPCKIAEAFDRWNDSVADARVETSRELVRQIGMKIEEVMEGGMHISNALDLALEALPNSTDEDQVRALLVMTKTFDCKIANVLHGLVGEVLAALERGNMLEASHYERTPDAVRGGGFHHE